MVGRAHVADIMMDSDTNPTNDLAAIVGECRVCQKTNQRLYYGRCPDCPLRNLPLKPYSYAAKHVVGYTLGGAIDIQFVTRVYRDVDLIVPRFDMTIDGAVFTPKMGLRILPIALQKWRNAVMLLSPSVGTAQ
jgi:hypothetical protein